MAFTVLAVTTSPPASGYSTPYRVSLAVNTSNTDGGDIYLNALGLGNGDVSGAVDLATLFGAAFNSQEVAAILKQRQSSNADTSALITKNLEITIVPLTESSTPSMVAWNPLSGIGSGDDTTVPFIHLIAPLIAGQWRVDITRRHSVAY